MKGIKELIQVCWQIKKEHDLSDEEVSKLLGKVKTRYDKKNREKEHISDLFNRTLTIIREEYEDE
ncbi:MAG: hypothetical protein ACOCQA_02495 [bacterium]